LAIHDTHASPSGVNRSNTTSGAGNTSTTVIALFGRQHTLGHVLHGIYEAYMRKSQKKPGTEVTVVIQSSTTVFSSVLQYFQKCSKKYVEMQ